MPCLYLLFCLALPSRYCPIAQVPFRGAPCSDAAGREFNFGDLFARVHAGNTTTGRQWDALLQSPWYNYKASDGTVHQVWYDDPESLTIKLAGAKAAGLGGVGVWTFDALDYNSTDPVVRSTMQDMWTSFDAFLK